MISFIRRIDWVLLSALLPIMFFGLVTMRSFTGADHFFNKQVIWIIISLVVFFVVSLLDVRFLKRTGVLAALFFVAAGLLALVAATGPAIRGASSWFSFGGFSFQPSDPAKIVLILMLAKYFSRRHVEIAHVKHILVSGLYALTLFLLILLQPDFGSAVIIFFIWLSVVIVAGVSKKHLFAIFAAGALSFVLAWSFAFAPYQKDRIITFLNPLTDIRGAGWNAYQSTVAVGSGELFGKGVGYGTQSRLQFLPEYETDFIFAAFAEEWGFVGVLILLFLYGVVVWRILQTAILGASNFEMLYGVGVALFLMGHIVVNVGMNMGLLPVTGIPLPFMSYGGSHLLTELLALGILMSMRRDMRAAHRDQMKNEFVGI